MASLPQYLMGQNQFDTTPIENGLAKFFQRQQWQQEQANKQRQLDFEAQRVGMDQQRLGFQAERQPYELTGLQLGNERSRLENQGIPLQQNLTREQIAAATQSRLQDARMNPERYAAAVEQGRHARVVNPIEEAAKYKALEGDPLQAFDPEKRYGFKDPKAPGGVRWLDIPDGGNGGPGQKKFNEKTGEMAAERYGTMIKHGDTQPELLYNLKRMEELSSIIGSPTARTQIADKFGPQIKALGLDPKNMKEIELFTSIINKMAPNLRPPGSGPTSNFDLEGYLKSLPAIAQTVDGRKMIIDHLRAVSTHSMLQADIAKRATLGHITRGQAEEMMAALPDPHMIWKKFTGTAPTVEITPRQSAPVVGPGEPSPNNVRTNRIYRPEDAAKLPKGTRFIGIDGDEREVK